MNDPTTQQGIGDAMEIAPDLHEVILENDRVRVLAYDMEPGDRAELHRHPDSVVYHLEGTCTARGTSPEGEAREFELEPGLCVFSPASAHVFEVVAGEPGRGLIIELK